MRAFTAMVLSAAMLCTVDGFAPASIVGRAAGRDHLFLRGSGRLASIFTCSARIRRCRSLMVNMADGSSDDEDAPVSGPNPEDWRAFRTALIERGIQMTESAGDTKKGDSEGKVESAADPFKGQGSLKKSVSSANEALLMVQNPEMADEYLQGVWAHETGEPEVGGLLARMPLDFQMVHLMRRAQHSVQGTPETELEWGQKLFNRLKKEAGEDESGVGGDERIKQWAGRMSYVYKLGGSLVTEELNRIISAAGGMRIDPDRLSEENRALLLMYVASLESWQEVLLVLEHDGPSTSGVIINRPLQRGIDSDLAQMLLRGLEPTTTVPASTDPLVAASVPRLPPPPVDMPFLLKFLQAFGGKGSVYFGGPEDQGEKGLMIHGIANLRGAHEISPGTGIYCGGEVDAVEGVLSGKYSVLDFRFFVGRKHFGVQEGDSGKSLTRQMACGAYKSFACARTVALKQCLGLPKPLWHEVLELCGGEPRDISKIEILKRDDLTPDS